VTETNAGTVEVEQADRPARPFKAERDPLTMKPSTPGMNEAKPDKKEG
jgi:hypothetical protein